jgi:hypothetical protein
LLTAALLVFAWFNARDHTMIEAASRRGCIGKGGHISILGANSSMPTVPEGKKQRRWSNADNQEWNTVQPNALSHRSGIRSEASAPQTISDDREVLFSRFFVLRDKSSSHGCRHTEDTKEIAGYPRNSDGVQVRGSREVGLGR